MRVIDSVSGFDNDVASAEATVSADNPFVENGVLDSVAFAEMIAQAFAGCKGLDDSVSGAPPRKGMLVAMKTLEVTGTAKVGDALVIELTKTGEFESFAMVDGNVQKDGEMIASASLRVWLEA